jgi:uncharacterized protein DUF6364
MNTKLTLRMDENLIKSAKAYSAKTGKSASRIVADLFEIIQNEEKDYKKHLEKKYL